MKTKFLYPFILIINCQLSIINCSAQYTKLHDFTSASNGCYPKGSLISDGTFFYGMTWAGSTAGFGTVFKIKPDGTGYAELLDFANDTVHGTYPYGSLFFDGTFLYGMTSSGGAKNSGTIFKIMPDGTGYSKLLDFTGTANGSAPNASLISDGTFLYGTTTSGGTNGNGTIFKIMPDGTGYVKLLDLSATASGNQPYGSLIYDGTFLYGTTASGGTNSMGTLFKIMPDGTGYSKLLDFSGTANGSNPNGDLISNGAFLYGTTAAGGTNGSGTLFKIMPDGTGYSKLLDFSGTTNGSNPTGYLISDGTFLYGMTYSGGANSMGTLYKIKYDGTGYSTLIDFSGIANGSNPYGSLISDGTFLYGMAYHGGKSNAYGVIFKIKTDGTSYSTLFDFSVAESGGYPNGDLISVGGFLYGMTTYGGGNNTGVVFKIMPDGTGYTKLLDFTGTANGMYPYGSLISDGTFLYGMTSQGGVNNMGTIFKIMPDGTGYAKLLDFSGAANGKEPRGSFISDGTFLYGTTSQGGTNDMGVVFKIKPDGTGYSKLLNFAGASNGRDPRSALFSDGTFLYGTTQIGGTSTACMDGCGTLFKIKPDGTGYIKLLDFSGTANGSYPTGALISDGTFLYGTTHWGGSGSFCTGPGGCGTVFKIKPDGTGYSIMHNFGGGPVEAQSPAGSLISDGTFLYGMTQYGGPNTSWMNNGYGVIFKIKPDGSGYIDLLNFDNANGSNPAGSLISDGTFLYGTTSAGGTNYFGTIFKINPAGLGIAENDVRTNLAVYPNPFSFSTTLSLRTLSEQPGKNFKDATLTVYNSVGQPVKEMNNLSGQTIIFHRNDLPSGLYFIRLVQENRIVATGKIIIADN